MDTAYAANNDFGATATALDVLKQASMDSPDGIHIFPGTEQTCEESPKNCCKKPQGTLSIAQYVEAAYQAYSVYSAASLYASGGVASMASGTTAAIGSISSALGATTTTTSTTVGTTLIQTTQISSSLGTVTSSTAFETLPEGVQGPMQCLGTTVSSGSGVLGAAATALAVVGAVFAAYELVTTIYNIMFACDTEDMTTSIDVGYGLCHYVGTSCRTRILGICVSENNVYCCFSSLLARIVQEQGRLQLTDMPWGTGDNPNCAGIGIGDFANIDWSEINLTQYTQYIEQTTEISSSQQSSIQSTVTTNVNNGTVQ